MKREVAKQIENMLKNMEELKGWISVLKEANKVLSEGRGPAYGNDQIFNAIPGKVIGGTYYAIIVDAEGKPVDWYAASDDPEFLSGFGGYWKYSYDELIKENPWIERIVK